MAQSAVDVALKKFIATTDRVSQFEANINTPGARETDVGSQYMCEVHRNQIRALWEKVEKSYESCSDLLAESDNNAAISTVLESKYSFCYSVYSRCIAQLREKIVSHTTPASVNVHRTASTGCRLPPVDTEVFAGDYLRWPTFRDLFTAIYIQNSRLTPVERWFHLLSKTSGDAHAIVSKAPLTHEGFVVAWQSLTDRFENRRLLKMYVEFMEEYESLGHMSTTSNNVLATPHYVIPHQCVLRPQSTSTKLRVVFDASCKTSTHKCLNDLLMVGPTIQEELYSILLR
ncbi:hypothetical protein KR074_005690, partial [Drosophila pseudoananassae]